MPLYRLRGARLLFKKVGKTIAWFVKSLHKFSPIRVRIGGFEASIPPLRASTTVGIATSKLRKIKSVFDFSKICFVGAYNLRRGALCASVSVGKETLTLKLSLHHFVVLIVFFENALRFSSKISSLDRWRQVFCCCPHS